jgi:hypothetical protein
MFSDKRIEFYEHMAGVAKEANTDAALGYWKAAALVTRAAQHRMHWTALWVGLGSFVLGFATCAIILYWL